MASSIFVQPGGVTSDGAGNVTVSGQLLLPDGTTTAPSLAFTSQPGFGLRRGGSGLLDFIHPAYSTTAPMIRFHTSFGMVVGSNRGMSLVPTGGADTSPGSAASLYSNANNQLQLANGNATTGVGLDFTTNNLLLLRNLAFNAYTTLDTLALKASGAAGASFGPSAVASLTTVSGIVTAAS